MAKNDFEFHTSKEMVFRSIGSHFNVLMLLIYINLVLGVSVKQIFVISRSVDQMISIINDHKHN